MRGPDLAADRARAVRRRWRRATGADSAALADQRVADAAVAVREEVLLMEEADRDLRALEDVVVAVAERRLQGGE